MNLIAIGQVLFLLGVANGAPVLAKWLIGGRFDWPIDGSARLSDGRALFGSSKTYRGVATSLLATMAAAELARLSWAFGAIVAALSMAGDLLSSFAKRRCGAAPSDQMLGVDQIPEAILPALFAAWAMGLSILDVLVVVVLFFIAELVGSRLLFALKIKDRPY
jgi:CDP-2,3-bis-(O-geranylgeranyl)-sn-glycerol synthase